MAGGWRATARMMATAAAAAAVSRAAESMRRLVEESSRRELDGPVSTPTPLQAGPAPQPIQTTAFSSPSPRPDLVIAAEHLPRHEFGPAPVVVPSRGIGFRSEPRPAIVSEMPVISRPPREPDPEPEPQPQPPILLDPVVEPYAFPTAASIVEDLDEDPDIEDDELEDEAEDALDEDPEPVADVEEEDDEDEDDLEDVEDDEPEVDEAPVEILAEVEVETEDDVDDEPEPEPWTAEPPVLVSVAAKRARPRPIRFTDPAPVAVEPEVVVEPEPDPEPEPSPSHTGKGQHRRSSGAISGTVTSSRGRGLRGILVTAYDADEQVVGRAHSGSTGTFIVEELPAGTYRVSAVDEDGDFVTAWLGGTTFATAASLKVKHGKTRRKIRLGLVSAAEIALDVDVRKKKVNVDVRVTERGTGAPAGGRVRFTNQAFSAELPLDAGRSEITLLGSADEWPGIPAALEVDYLGDQHVAPVSRTAKVR